MTDLALQAQADKEIVRGIFTRIDEDLVALDERVDRRRQECERADADLHRQGARINILEEKVQEQRTLIEKMSARLDAMEGRLCHCRKGKGKELGEVESFMDSPLIRGARVDEDSDGSFHTPSYAGASLPSHSSSSVVESDKENKEPSGLVEIVEDPMENVIPIPVPVPTLNIAELNKLIAVRGQRAYRSAGPPKRKFHPYSHCCALGGRSSTHRKGSRCSRFGPPKEASGSEGSGGWGSEFL